MEQQLKTIDRLIVVSFMGFSIFSIFSISLTQTFATIGGIAWLIKSRLTGNKAKWPLATPWLIFVFACLLAVATSVDPLHSYKSLKKLLELLIFFWVVNCLSASDPGELFAWLKNLVSNETIKNYFSRLEENIRSVSPREFFFVLLIMSVSLATLYGFGQAILQGVSKSTRVAGTMSTYMTFAGMLMMAGLMVLSRMFFGRKLEPWAAMALGAIAICLFLTLTRQAWLGFVAGAAFLIYKRERKLLLALPVILVLVQMLAPVAVKERLASFANLKDATFLTRVDLWRGGWAIFKDHPLTGCGFKCVDKVYPQYPEHAKILARYKGMHNNVIQLAVDTGIVGVSAWISLWVCYLVALYRLSARNTGERWINLGCAGVILAFLAGGMFEVNFYDSEVVMLMYFLMALPFSDPKA
jgi:O-antigen ligase